MRYLELTLQTMKFVKCQAKGYKFKALSHLDIDLHLITKRNVIALPLFQQLKSQHDHSCRLGHKAINQISKKLFFAIKLKFMSKDCRFCVTRPIGPK